MSITTVVKAIVLGAVVTLIIGMVFLLVYIVNPSGSQGCGFPMPWINIKDELFGLNRGQEFDIAGFVIDTIFWSVPIYFLSIWHEKHKRKKMRKIVIY